MQAKFKILAFIPVILALVRVVNGQSTCNGNNNAVAGYNPFLNWIGSSTVLGSVYTSSNFEVCNDIWSDGNVGTCCNKDRINSTFSRILNDTVTVWNNYITSLVFLRNEIRTEMVDHYTSRVDAQQAFQSMQGDKNYDLGGLSAGQAVFILDLISSFDADMKNFRKDGKTCFDFLMKKRGQIFCWGCKFGGESFFVAGGPTAKITPNSAQLLVETCHSTWKFLARSMLLRFVWNNYQKYRSDTFVVETFHNLTKLDLFYYSASTDNYGTVFTAFDNCPNPTSYQTSSANCKPADLQVLTKAFFNFGIGEKLMNFKWFTNIPGRLLQDTPTEKNPLITFDAAGIDLTKYPSMATPFINTTVLEFWTAGGIKSSLLLRLSYFLTSGLFLWQVIFG